MPFQRYLVALTLLMPVFATAHETAGIAADGHAPIGVMGDHRHAAGEWMVSYRCATATARGLVRGSDAADPDAVAAAGAARVVPEDMRVEMHMLGVMYAPDDRVTLMGMVRYLEKDMEMTTYRGTAGADLRGTFTASSRGPGDTTLSALVGVYGDVRHDVHLNLGWRLPTGAVDERGTALTPRGALASMRLPYGMQLGSGTVDFEPGITYNGREGRVSWGAQYRATVRLGENDEGYSLGNRQQLSAWGALRPRDWWSVSLRLVYSHVEKIDGRDRRIVAPATTADPDNYGGERLDAAAGINLAGQPRSWPGHRLALEYQVPLTQHVNGVQLEADAKLTVGYQYAF